MAKPALTNLPPAHHIVDSFIVVKGAAGGYDIARFVDAWSNLWWLFTPTASDEKDEWKASTDWHSAEPSQIYTTLMDTMRSLKDPNK